MVCCMFLTVMLRIAPGVVSKNHKNCTINGQEQATIPMRILRSDQLLVQYLLVVQASSRSILLTSAAGAVVVFVDAILGPAQQLLLPLRPVICCFPSAPAQSMLAFGKVQFVVVLVL